MFMMLTKLSKIATYTSTLCYLKTVVYIIYVYKIIKNSDIHIDPLLFKNGRIYIYISITLAKTQVTISGYIYYLSTEMHNICIYDISHVIIVVLHGHDGINGSNSDEDQHLKALSN